MLCILVACMLVKLMGGDPRFMKYCFSDCFQQEFLHNFLCFLEVGMETKM